MSLSVGIVGLPNVGKSTLFNALLKKQQALVANYPFATIEPNVGVVGVPDERLEKLVEVVVNASSPSTWLRVSRPTVVPATVTFVDIAGLVKGASSGAGLGNKFLAHIREVSAIAHVVRAFSDADVVKEGSVDPKSDFETVRMELEPLAKKPEILVINVAEEDLGKTYQRDAVVICAKVEAELAELSEEDQKAYLKELGVDRSGLERLIKAAYQKLDLISFLTAGEKEVRAWTIKQGTKAVEAAGVIHTDFMKAFIKADVIGYEDFVKVGGWKNAREEGLVRSEGRDYVMQEGEVVEFKVGV